MRMVCPVNNIFYFSYMKKFIEVVLLISLMGCGAKHERKQDYLGIPDKVEIKENENSIQFPDTRVFMVMPAGYELNAAFEKARVRKNKLNFIDVTEEPNRSIDEVKDAFERTIEEIEEKKPEATCKIQDFKLGDYDARLIYMSNILPGTDKATLIIGNEKYAASVGSSFENEDAGMKKEIIDIMLTSYIKPDAKPDHTPFAKYTIDLSGSKLKFNSLSNKYMHKYTINGYSEEDSPGNNTFIVIQVPDTTTTIAGKKEIAQMIMEQEKNKDDGITINFAKEQEVQINNAPAYEIVTDKTYEKTHVKSYFLCADVEGKTFLFTGTIFKDFDQTIAEYRRIIETMKLKHL